MRVWKVAICISKTGSFKLYLFCNLGRCVLNVQFESPCLYDMCKWIDGCAGVKLMKRGISNRKKGRKERVKEKNFR